MEQAKTKKKFQLKELPTPKLALRQSCSCGASVLVKKESIKRRNSKK